MPLPAGVQGAYTMTVSMMVSDGSGEGLLEGLMVNDHKPPVTGDLCGPEAAARVKDLPGTPCRQLTTGGVQIRVSTEKDDAGRDVVVATRFLDGGFLELVAQQSVPAYSATGELPPDAATKHPGHRARHRPWRRRSSPRSRWRHWPPTRRCSSDIRCCRAG